MKYSILTTVLCITLIAEYSISQKFQLTGRVIEGDTEMPYGGATVTIADRGFGAISDAEGLFGINEVPKGQYTVNFSAPGYERASHNIRLTRDMDMGIISLFKRDRRVDSPVSQQAFRSFHVHAQLSGVGLSPNLPMIYGIAPEPTMVMGSFFLDPEYNEGSLLMYKEKEVLEEVLVRLRLENNSFDIKDKNSGFVRNIPGIWVENFVMIDSKSGKPRFFINGKDFLIENEPAVGFFELMVDGAIPLLKKIDAIYKRSNYNPSIQIGYKNDQIVKKESYYYVSRNHLVKAPRSTGKILKVFYEKKEEMNDYIKNNNLSLKYEKDLFQAFAQFNKIYAMSNKE